VHDPAWWWVKASNLGGPGGPVVRFNLAHGDFVESYFPVFLATVCTLVMDEILVRFAHCM